MNPQETLQAAARNEKWVPSAERVKISSTNIRLETTQIWYTIKKVPDIDSYEFLLANKKCSVNAEVFRTILDICPRVKGVDFADVPDDDTALTFLIDLGYKGPLNRHTNIENVDYPELIREDFAYQIDYMKEKRSRRKDYQEYGLPIPDVMLTDETVDVSEESEPELEPAKKKTASKGVVKKKVTLSADDNIISDDPDDALELAKSISQTKVEEAEAARKVHATHARIVTESVPEFAKKKSGGRSPKSIVIQDTPTANIMQALKDSEKTSRRLPSIRGSNEGTSSKLGVPDESTVVSATSSEGTGAKPRVLDNDKDITKEKVILNWGDKQDSEHFDDDNDDVKKNEKDGDADDEAIIHVRLCSCSDTML
ncbi:hypothetical protein Tco_0415451 [Tanacetum coccineum]